MSAFTDWMLEYVKGQATEDLPLWLEHEFAARGIVVPDMKLVVDAVVAAIEGVVLHGKPPTEG